MDCGIGSAANRRRIVSLKFHLVLVVGSFPQITYVNLDYYGTTSELKMTNKKQGSLALCAHPWVTEKREFPLERGCHGLEPVTPTVLTAYQRDCVAVRLYDCWTTVSDCETLSTILHVFNRRRANP